MMKYDGYTKIKEGAGRNARFVERHIYKCTECGAETCVAIERLPVSSAAPKKCPKCGKE